MRAYLFPGNMVSVISLQYFIEPSITLRKKIDLVINNVKNLSLGVLLLLESFLNYIQVTHHIWIVSLYLMPSFMVLIMM